MYYNASQEEHPLHAYLVEEGVSRELVESDHVEIQALLINGHSYEHFDISCFDYQQKSFSNSLNFIETRFYENSTSRELSCSEGISASEFSKILHLYGIKDLEVVAHLTPKPKNWIAMTTKDGIEAIGVYRSN